MHPMFHQVCTGFLATLILCAVGYSQPQWEYFGYRTITCVEASSDTLFVGTDKSLVLIDKKTQGIRTLDRTNSPLPSNYIRSLVRDHANRLWIGTNRGVVRYDDWVNVRPNSKGYIAFDRNGQLWVSEDSLGSVGVYDGSTWTEYVVGPNPGPIVVDSAGAVWVQSYYFASPQGGLTVALKRFDGVSWESLSVFGGVIRSMVADTSSIIIANSAGVRRFDGTGWHPLSLPFPDSSLASSLSLDSLNQLWVGCADGRLFGSDSSGWKEVPPASSGRVATINFSRDTIFVGSGGGVVVLHGGERELWAASEYDFPPGRFGALTTNSKGKLWAAFDDGFGSRGLYVAGCALGSWGVDTISSLAGVGVYDIAVGVNDVLWVASAGGGLVKVDHGIETQWRYPTAGIPKNYVFNIAVEKTGAIWCSTNKISQFDGSNWTTYSSANRVFPADAARDIAIDSANNIWVSFPTYGIAKYNQQGNWSFRTLSDLGISSSMITCLNAAPNGELWVGSLTAGLLRIRNNTVTTFSTENSSIPSNQIHDISFGSEGTVWFTSSAGMTCFDGIVFSTFSPANAPLESIDYDAQIVADGVGNVWINNAGGLLRYQFKVSTGVLDHPSGEGAPSTFVLHGSYPNPFNPSTTIRYELPATSHVKLSVLDLLGRVVSVLVDERRDSGVHEVNFDGSGLSSGVYFCMLQAGEFVQTQKIVLLQ